MVHCPASLGAARDFNQGKLFSASPHPTRSSPHSLVGQPVTGRPGELPASAHSPCPPLPASLLGRWWFGWRTWWSSWRRTRRHSGSDWVPWRPRALPAMMAQAAALCGVPTARSLQLHERRSCVGAACRRSACRAVSGCAEWPGPVAALTPCWGFLLSRCWEG